jgi:adenylate cyclase
MSLEPHGELIPIGGGDPIPLIRDVLTVGRRESCDICLRFPNVSGLHCELTFRDGYWHIRDCNSTNGIKVNGMRVPQKYLHPGEKISIANRHFTIEYQLQAGRPPEEVEEEEDVMGISLMEKAGLVRPRRPRDNGPKNFDAGEFLLGDE